MYEIIKNIQRAMPHIIEIDIAILFNQDVFENSLDIVGSVKEYKLHNASATNSSPFTDIVFLHSFDLLFSNTITLLFACNILKDN